MSRRPTLPQARVAPLLLAMLITTTIAVGPAAEPSRAAALPLAGVVVAIDPGHNGGNAAHARQIARRVWIGNRWKPCNQVGTSTRSRLLGASLQLPRRAPRPGPPPGARGDGVPDAHDRHRVRAVRRRPGAVRGARRRRRADQHPRRRREQPVSRLLRDATGPGQGLHRRHRDAVGEARHGDAGGLLAAGLPVANYYAKNGIKTRTDLGTLNWSDVPAVMIELGNMKNSTDAARMVKASGRARYADGVVAGIRRYFGK